MSSLVIKKRATSGPQKEQIVVLVGKNVSKKATQRNLLKRRIKAIMRSIIKGAGKDNEFLIVVKPEARQLTFKELKEEIENKTQNGRNF